MGYNITPKIRANAKRIGVSVKSSTNPKKKLDVFKGGKKVASVGATGYKDFHLHTKTKGKEFALKRQKAYQNRHAKNINKKGSPGFYANELLWK